MSSATTDKVNGFANNAVGNVKEAAGAILGNDKLKSEGQAQQLKGDAQKVSGNLKDAITDTVHKVGEVIGQAGEKIEHKASDSVKEVLKKADELIGKASEKIKHLGE